MGTEDRDGDKYTYRLSSFFKSPDRSFIQIFTRLRVTYWNQFRCQLRTNVTTSADSPLLHQTHQRDEDGNDEKSNNRSPFGLTKSIH